jgi:hypothetical protein
MARLRAEIFLLKTHSTPGLFVIPVKTGIQQIPKIKIARIPAFAGMTKKANHRFLKFNPLSLKVP